MTDSERSLREKLITSFDDYHSHISAQLALLDRLVELVRQDERERCAAIADASTEKGAGAGAAIAAAIRATPHP